MLSTGGGNNCERFHIISQFLLKHAACHIKKKCQIYSRVFIISMALVKYFFIFGAFLSVCAHLPPPCDSAVYCHGPLLHTVQLSRIFNDSKTFVDMKMKNNSAIILNNFEKFMAATNNTPSKEQIRTFVDQNFEEGKELEQWYPGDYTENPKFLLKISDPVLKDFARHLVQFWPMLARKVKPEVIQNVDRYSFIPVTHGFVVPGGRFGEYYYWDSYWIINGLLISEMHDTVRGMIDNYIHLVKTYGFVPNGGRVYYLNRSQPPLLTKMATLYYKYTKDKQWLKQNLPFLRKELKFWLDKKTVQVTKDGKVHTMAHYNSTCTGPRPESYLEDFQTAWMYHNDAKDQLYMDLKSGAESGWDFSSRWIFDHKGGNMANLSHIEARRVIPVDLNSYLCEAFKSLSFLYSEVGDSTSSEYWEKLGLRWQKSIEEVLWDDEDGIWYDFDSKLSQPRKYFYPSNVAPLWTGCFDKDEGQSLGLRVLNYLENVGALDTPGGVGASMSQTGEQWDFPNGWAPLQAILVQALERSRQPDAMAAAQKLAAKWLRANIKGFRDSGVMFEKYDILRPGTRGGGGEYVVQAGFGWTNGVALRFINDYFSRDARVVN